MSLLKFFKQPMPILLWLAAILFPQCYWSRYNTLCTNLRHHLDGVIRQVFVVEKLSLLKTRLRTSDTMHLTWLEAFHMDLKLLYARIHLKLISIICKKKLCNWHNLFFNPLFWNLSNQVDLSLDTLVRGGCCFCENPFMELYYWNCLMIAPREYCSCYNI